LRDIKPLPIKHILEQRAFTEFCQYTSNSIVTEIELLTPMWTLWRRRAKTAVWQAGFHT
jgi:hypothetical protein